MSRKNLFLKGVLSRVDANIHLPLFSYSDENKGIRELLIYICVLLRVFLENMHSCRCGFVIRIKKSVRAVIYHSKFNNSINQLFITHN
jgi:hypothetical protein